MTDHWKFIYLHSGDTLHVSKQGAQLGRKKSTKSTLEVDDDLPGHQLNLGGSAGGSRSIYTLPHGSRAVQVIKKIEDEFFIEEGDKNSFFAPQRIPKKPRNDELERGRIFHEEAIHINLGELTNKTLNQIVEGAMRTSVKLWKKQLPNLRGLCGAQRVKAMENYRKEPAIRLQFSYGPNDKESIEEVLGGILSTRDPKAYIDDRMILILEFMIMNEFLSKSGFDIPSQQFFDRFENLFNDLEALGFTSKFVLPARLISTRTDFFNLIKDMLRILDFTSLHPFIDEIMGVPGKLIVPFESWMDALNQLKIFFPTHSSLDWMESQEGNDVAMQPAYRHSAVGNVWIDLFSILINHVRKPEIPRQFENFGICLRDAATFHHGSRVVCDRKISNPSERIIRSCIDMYDSSWNAVCPRIDISNDLRLTHDNTPIRYSQARWMVIRLGNLSPQTDTLRFKIKDEIRNQFEHERPNNPWEAFVTLPWFITYDESRKTDSAGVLDVCSQQLVHVHFIETSHADEAFVVIPVQVRTGDGFKITQNIPLESTTTICFRAMYSTQPSKLTESLYPNFESNATPGTRWWVERPSYLT